MRYPSGQSARVGDLVSWHVPAGQLNGRVIKVGSDRGGNVQLTIQFPGGKTVRHFVTQIHLCARGE